MPTPRTAGSPRVLLVAFAACLLWFAWQSVQLAQLKYFGIDEFQYAHAAWLVSHGQVPYRDFFEVHFPLVYQVLSPVFAVSGDDPTAISLLRLGMLPFVAIAAVSAAMLAGRDRLAAILAPVLLLALPPFVTLATEIRPDAVAAALFLAALAVLRLERVSDRVAGASSGFLLVASAWGAQKAVVYGAVLGIALAIDLVAAKRVSAGTGATKPLVRSPRAFVAGLATGIAMIGIYLTATDSWAAWWHWCFAWAVEHQRNYPGFSWRLYFTPLFLDAVWLFVLAGWGLGRVLQSLVAQGASSLRSPDVLLAGALASTFASFALQRAPFPYSFLPFLGVVAVFAAKGAADLLSTPSRPVIRGLLAGALFVVLGFQSIELSSYTDTSNIAQLDTLSKIGKLTDPGDAAYDNSGGYVARPHAYPYFYTDQFLRESMAGTLSADVPRSILERGAVLHLRDLRFKTLPADLQAFLDRHFQPYDGDIALWGQHYQNPGSGGLDDVFLASREDRYFVTPESAATGGQLSIDGQPVREAVFSLSRGEHRVSYHGPSSSINILWLPRDGVRWEPRRGLLPTFSRSLRFLRRSTLERLY